MTSATSIAARALFDCSGPTRCHCTRTLEGGPGVASCNAAAFDASSWTRFSPRTSNPAAIADRSRATSTVFETATSVTSSGERPVREQASAMRRSTRSRALRKDSTSVIGRPAHAGPGSLSAQEARDLEILGVVRAARRRGRGAHRALDADVGGDPIFGTAQDVTHVVLRLASLAPPAPRGSCARAAAGWSRSPG